MPAASAATSTKRKASSLGATAGKAAPAASKASSATPRSASSSSASAKKAKSKAEGAGALIDGHVSQMQVEKALKALEAHRKRTQTEEEKHQLPLSGLDDVDGEGARADPADVMWLMVTTKTINENAPPKPVRITLPHAVYAPSSSVCLLTKDPQRQYKDLLASEKVKQVKRVVGVTKLKGKFAPFDARRQLMNDHEVFLADDRIVEMLPKLLGKKWIKERKSPIPVKLSGKGAAVKAEIEKAVASTYYHRNRGVCTATRIGTLAHLSTEELLANVSTALPVIVGKHVKGGWDNMQGIEIKTGRSAGLPVWNCKMEDRWAGMPTEEEEEERKKARKEARSKKNMDEAQWYKEYGQDKDDEDDEDDEEEGEGESGDEEPEDDASDDEDEEDEGDIEQEEARARKVQRKSAVQTASLSKKGKK